MSDELVPAYWVPGVVVVESGAPGEPARVRLGPDVGWVRPREIEDWKREVLLVEKRLIDEGREADDVPALPERRIDLVRFPHVHRAAVAATLVAFPVEEEAELAREGMRVYRVAWHRVSSGGVIAATGGGQPAEEVSGEIYGLEVLTVEGAAPPASWSEDFDDVHCERRPTADRIARALSHGVVNDDSAELAAALLEALSGAYGPVDEVLASWNTWLGAVLDRAREHDADAHAFAAALSPEANEAMRAGSPLAGRVRRLRRPSLTIRRSDGSSSKGREAEPPLVLPPDELLLLDGVEPWRPSGDPLYAPPSPRSDRKQPPRSIVSLLLLAAAVIAWLLLRR